MGSGGKFRSDKIPISQTVTTYAAVGNLQEAIKNAEEAVTAVSNGSTDPKDWQSLEQNTERIKSRSITLVSVLRSILRGQEK